MKNSQKLDLNISLQNNQITNSKNTKYLRLTIEETLSWKYHINHILSKLTSACYAVRGYFTKDLLFVRTFDNNTQHNFLGKLTA
jgi:hypothetical protein